MVSFRHPRISWRLATRTLVMYGRSLFDTEGETTLADQGAAPGGNGDGSVTRHHLPGAYSCLSAFVGFVLDARTAGTAAATSDVTTSRAATLPVVTRLTLPPVKI